MGAGRGYLPPVIAAIVADMSDLAAKLELAKSALEEFDGTEATAHITAEDDTRDAAIALRARLEAMFGSPITQQIRVEVDGGGSAALAAAAAAGGGGGGGADLAALAAASGGGRKGKNPLAGLAAAAFWGGGKMRGGGLPGPFGFLNPFGMGLAGIGSIGSFAGLGAEHLLMTMLGIGGSGVSALGGAGLSMLGAAGPMAVGGGSDMIVMRSAIADTKTLYQDQQNLAKAVALYGANSKQAAAATKQLNYDMQSLGNTAGVKAEAGVAALAATLNTQFDMATSAARVQAAGLMTQVLNLASTYVPLVANAANTNLGIINSSIKPLFDWLGGPQGTGIFTDLENHFAKNLPYSVDAFSQAIQFLMRTLDYLAQKSGNAMQRLDTFMQHLNSPAGFANWQRHMDHMLTSFHVWGAFLKILGKDIADLFKLDAGTGQAIVQTLTDMLTQLNKWETSTAGKSQISNLFTLHKQEIIDLLNLIPPLLVSFSRIYMAVAPVLTQAVDTVLPVLAKLLGFLASNPFGQWVLGLSLIAAKLGILKPLLAPVVDGLGSIAKLGIGKLADLFGVDGKFGGNTKFSTAVDTFAAAVDKFAMSGGGGSAVGAAEGAAGGSLLRTLGGVALIGGGILGGNAAGSAIGQSVGGTSGKQTGGIMGDILGGAAGGAAVGAAGLPIPIVGELTTVGGALIGGLIGAVVAFWPQITGAIHAAFSAVIGVFTGLPGVIGRFASSIPGAVGGFFQSIGRWFSHVNWQSLGVSVGTAIRHFIVALVGWLLSLPAILIGGAVRVGEAIGGFIKSIVSMLTHIDFGKAATSIGSGVAGFAKGVVDTITHINWGDVARRVSGAVAGFFGGIASFLWGLLQGLTAGWAGTIAQKWNDLWTAVTGLFQRAADGIRGFFSQVAKTVGQVWTAITGLFWRIVNAVNDLNPFNLVGNALGKHATGGVIAAGTYSLVGEEGPELAYAGPNGTAIFSNRSNATQKAMGGGATVHISAPINVTVPPGTSNPEQLARAIERAVERQFAALTRSLVSGAYAGAR